MIDLNGLKNACTDLHKRCGINFELQDANNTVLFKTSEFNGVTDNSSSVTAIPRSNKNYSVYALGKNGAPLDDTVIQLISALLEPYLTSKDPCDIFRDFIYSKITPDVFNQLLSSFNIVKNMTYRIYLIRCAANQVKDIFFITQEMSDTSAGDMLFKLNDENIILIKECSNELTPEEAFELASALEQSISLEIVGKNITIATSQVYKSLAQLKDAYDDAADALRLGAICTSGKSVYISEKLRIEVFLDMLPPNILREFLALHSGQTISEAWDDKMIETVQSLFDNNLNLSVTARELYTHRNTLVYRLDKIKKISGLDLKSFDDAVMFKILMVADKLINNS